MNRRGKCAISVSTVVFLAGLMFHSASASAKQITLLMSGDWHATLEPHAAVFRGPNLDDEPTYATQAGGLAKVTTVIKNNYTPGKTVFLTCGDMTHGSAEGLFTVGDAVIKAVNAVDKAIEDMGGNGVDAFTPGNWDFGYGPAIFRNRFDIETCTGTPGPQCPPLPANLRVMAGYEGSDGNNFESNLVIQANFDAISINLKNAANGSPILPAYKIINRNGVRIGVIGITAAIVPQQADVFNLGLRFTQGVEELPGVLEAVKAKGVDLIVVQSELGLAQNIEIARSFRDIDVMYSAHTHETTHGALIADYEQVTRTTPGGALSGDDKSRLARGAAIVIETDRDMYVGRLDVDIAGGKIVNFDWEAIPVDDAVEPDRAVQAVVAAIEEPFTMGSDGSVTRHTFLPGGFCPDNECGDTNTRGLQLVDDLDTVVGTTGVLLERHDVLEDVLNNFIADAIRAVTGSDISMTNGFRFGTVVLSEHEVSPGTMFADGRATGEITLRDLYTWFPVGPAVNLADFSGQAVEESLEVILNAVFNRNPFLQRGGWYLGLSNMTQTLDLINRPFSSSGGRIIQTKVGDEPLDPSKRYSFASCYAHGDAIDRVCRTGGGANHQFFTISNVDNPVVSTIGLVDPATPGPVIVPGSPPQIKQVAPDNFLHPVHVLQIYLASNHVTESAHGTGRVVEVNSTDPTQPPAYTSAIDPTFVQPPEGTGPTFFSGRIGD
jgi:2',3'-cyclic-nucleotide 2'-phosphodiesterase (5'-nucleotidase family)